MKGGISHFTFKARYKTNNKLNPNPSRDLGIVNKVSIFASVWHLEPLECVCVFCVKSRLIKHIKVGASVFQEISLRYSYISPVTFLSLSSESILFRRSPGKHFPESPWKWQSFRWIPRFSLCILAVVIWCCVSLPLNSQLVALGINIARKRLWFPLS